MIEYRLSEEGFLIEVEKENKLEQLNNINNLNIEKETKEQKNDIVDNNEENLSDNDVIGNEISLEEVGGVPAKRGFWAMFKEALFKDINIFPKTKLTPYEVKVFTEVKDFWTQDMRKLFK